MVRFQLEMPGANPLAFQLHQSIVSSVQHYKVGDSLCHLTKERKCKSMISFIKLSLLLKQY